MPLYVNMHTCTSFVQYITSTSLALRHRKALGLMVFKIFFYDFDMMWIGFTVMNLRTASFPLTVLLWVCLWFEYGLVMV